MSQVYDSWERLVRATLRREQLRLIGQRTPSDLSLASSSSFSFSASSRRVSSFKVPSFLVGEAFVYDHILRASNYFSNSNLIRHGRSGDLFRGVLDNGTPVVFKKIDLSSAKMELYCLKELEFFGKVSHSRFVPLIGHCWDAWNDKFLVYKYMPKGDLVSSFFWKFDLDDEYNLVSLDWITRLKIAIGTAEALSYLHHECSPPLVHRDVQASSILLDDKYEVRLGSLNDFCAQEEEKQQTNQNMFTRFLRLPKASGKGTSGVPNATCAYDVYCFGKILLELVTGKPGIGATGDAAVKQEWLGQTIPYISVYDKELVTKIVDPSLIIDEDLLEEVWAMAIVAKSCLNPNSSRRPIMRYVLKALENPLEVVREEDTSLARLGDTSSRSSIWNAALFENWQSYKDVADIPVSPADTPVSGR